MKTKTDVFTSYTQKLCVLYYWAKKIFADMQLKFSRWAHHGLSRWTLSPMTAVLLRDTQRRRHTDRAGGGVTTERHVAVLRPPEAGTGKRWRGAREGALSISIWISVQQYWLHLQATQLVVLGYSSHRKLTALRMLREEADLPGSNHCVGTFFKKLVNRVMGILTTAPVFLCLLAVTSESLHAWFPSLWDSLRSQLNCHKCQHSKPGWPDPHPQYFSPLERLERINTKLANLPSSPGCLSHKLIRSLLREFLWQCLPFWMESWMGPVPFFPSWIQMWWLELQQPFFDLEVKEKKKQKTKNLFTNHRKWNQLKLRHHYTPTRWPKSQTLTALNVGEEQQEISSVAGGNAKWCSCFARCLGSFLPDEPAIALVGMIQRS